MSRAVALTEATDEGRGRRNEDDSERRLEESPQVFVVF